MDERDTKEGPSRPVVADDGLSTPGKVPKRSGAIALVLDGYDDIFSDFDPRPRAERAISDDFLNVCRKTARGKEGRGLELQLMLPEGARRPAEEAVIKRRLESYFLKHSKKAEAVIAAHRKKGWGWFGIGVACMLVGAFLRSGSIAGFLGLDESSFLFQLLLVVFEPAGWFLVWEGMYQILIGSKDHERESAFYKKMAAARVGFYPLPEGRDAPLP